jgi:hypothetical protein
VFARPETVPEFPTLCVVVFIIVSDFLVRGGFVDIDGTADHHDLKTFFSYSHLTYNCKIQKRTID